MTGKRAAGAQLALDLEPAFVALERVLDDRQSQTSAAAGARASLIHAIETLGQARDVFRRRADAAVGHGEPRAAAGAFPAHVDAPAGAGVLHGVGDQVAEDALRLDPAAVEHQRRVDGNLDAVLSLG